jgi:hypothetical protein
MYARSLAVAAAMISMLALAACDSDARLGFVAPSTFATVRFVNATDTPIDIATSGTIANGNGALSFGTSSNCILVGASASNVTVLRTGANTALVGFTPNFQSGGSFTVIIYPGVGGVPQFAILPNAFNPNLNRAGFRAFNAVGVGTNYDVYVTTSGEELRTASVNNVTFGAGSGFVDVDATTVQQVRITNAGSLAIVLNAGNQSFSPGVNSNFVIAPPGPGATTLRTFQSQACALASGTV